MSTVFSETLARLRAEAGFKTAYRFFHDNGGAGFFEVSYRNYLMMEQGRSLPALGRLVKLLVGMHMPLATPAARELTLAWLRTMAGPESFADLVEPLLSPQPRAGAPSPAEEALRRTLAGKKYQLSVGQVLVTISDFGAYRAFFIMETDSGSWTPAALAGALGIKKAVAGKILTAFLKAGIVKKEGGSYRSRLAGLLVEYPDGPAMPREVLARIKGYQSRLEKEYPMEFATSGLIRADSDAMRGYYPIMRSAVESSHAFATTQKTKKSAGFLVVSRVHRLWDF